MLARSAPHLTLAETVPKGALAARGPVLRGLANPGATISPCPPRSLLDIVCAQDDGCRCPLSGHVTNAERAVMNDIAHQASRLATVLALVLAAVAVSVMIMLVVR